MQWDLVTGDPDPRVSAKTIANTILTRAHPGAIVVAHANGRGRNTAAALAIALPKLKEQGYSFVTVSELLKAGKPVIAARCYQNSPRDMTRIARTHPGAAAMTSSPFSAVPIELAATGCTPARLLPLEQRSCASLAAGIVAMEPWSVMNYPADKLARSWQGPTQAPRAMW